MHGLLHVPGLALDVTDEHEGVRIPGAELDGHGTAEIQGSGLSARIDSEAGRPERPWVHARKIVTQANKRGDAHDFYNPTQHPFFDRDGGRVIYLEGSYVNTFGGGTNEVLRDMIAVKGLGMPRKGR